MKIPKNQSIALQLPAADIFLVSPEIQAFGWVTFEKLMCDMILTLNQLIIIVLSEMLSLCCQSLYFVQVARQSSMVGSDGSQFSRSLIPTPLIAFFFLAAFFS